MTLQQQRAFLCLFLFLHARSVWARVEVTMKDNVEVYLGDSAEIVCHYNFTEANSVRFVMFQWFVKDKGSSSRIRIYYAVEDNKIVDEGTEYSGRIQVTLDQHKTQLTIQEVQLSDEREFICQVNGLSAGTMERKTHLRVFAPPGSPVIRGVQTGISVTNEMPSKVATCEARNGYPKSNITWYRNNMPLVSSAGLVNVWTGDTVESSGLYSVQSTLEYQVVKEDKDANFSCEVSFFVPGDIMIVESSSVGITVHYPPTMVELWRESPQGLVKEGDTVELRCHGDGNPMPTFIFTRKEDPDVEFDSRGNVLMLQAVSRSDSDDYLCRPRDTTALKEVKGEMRLKVHYLDPAVLVPKESEVMLKGEDLTASCNALSSEKTSVVWYKDGNMVGRGNMLHLQDATYETAGEYVCEVTVPSVPALHTSGSVHIVVHGGPQLVGEEQEVHLEEAVGRMVNLSCEARGHPAPSITWIFVGSQNWFEVFSKSSDHMTHSVVSVAVKSDISAMCNTSNDLGIDVRAFSIKAIPLVTTSAPFSPEGSGVIIVVIILCLLLLAILGSVLYFLHKKGKIPCGRSGKQDISKEKTAKDDIVVEMKNNANAKSEDTVLLKAVNGDKNGTNDQ
ncbi:cell surface glycoprotein MUC18 isoform X1 [Phyllopteryx taeniolatus]|uniref:cell surface glycoprotein MUC18 isoform X1 n=1 Tax=Phyllopteryx taeniolatus TaxID=161469 RepID=UPI002AD52D1C|nr:cell surface glycoprotein MUC18 isoform X1 [Phyllopteryx taeniolatus]XP_061608055.1 cell surface glycoprotein MUC18 isoform X1 [Phyllopteryx taeniolatus]